MTTRQILALLNSHIEGDEAQFLAVALPIAAQQAREGKPDDAEKLRLLVQKARDQRRFGALSGGQTPRSLARPRAQVVKLPEGFEFPTQDVVVLRSERRDHRTESATLCA